MVIRMITVTGRLQTFIKSFLLKSAVPSAPTPVYLIPRSRLSVRALQSTSLCQQFVRQFATSPQKDKIPTEAQRLRTFASYIMACFVFMLGASYAGVPLYRMICQTTGFGGEVKQGHDASKVESMKPVRERVLRVRFNADTASSMQWNFRPQQAEIKLIPGETALAFYRAKNPTDRPIVGISTYNVVPFEAGQYFNKIQCFCFEEQRLNPHEEVDMPVFFYIDPEFCDDPKLERVDMITLSYTFFEAKEGLNLQMPNYYKPHAQ